MAEKRTPERVTFSPGEFAALFGKSQTWGYRQIYAGRVKTITEYGRILIPAAEVQKILASAERYEGKKRTQPKTKRGFQHLAPALQSAWCSFLEKRRFGGKSQHSQDKPSGHRYEKWGGGRATREEAISRLGGKIRRGVASSGFNSSNER